jgi:hypothetical protein
MSETEYSAGPPESTRPHRDGRALRELFEAEPPKWHHLVPAGPAWIATNCGG